MVLVSGKDYRQFHKQGDVVAWIQSFQRFGVKPGLERVQWMLDELGNPEQRLKIIHVAGTNGKGSTCKYIASAIEANGYRVGLFTSPYLEAFNNRIAINQSDIDEENLCLVADEVRVILDNMPMNELGQVTEFELITAIALLYYWRKKVDYVVLEVGLGGRLDATNVVRPLISVITNIGYDHIHILGNSLPEIAREKAGIIKEGIPVVCGAKQMDVLEVIRQVCKEKNTSIYELAKDFHNKIDMISLQELRVLFSFQGKSFLDRSTWSTQLTALYQADNIAVALATLCVLQWQGKIQLSGELTQQGISKAKWEGRFEVMQAEPTVIVDGAHNPEGFQALVESLESQFGKDTSYIWCIGFLADKKIDDMLEIMVKKAKKIIVTRPNSERSADPFFVKERVIAILQKHQNLALSSSDISINEEIDQALSMTLQQANEEDIISVAGSLYMISEARTRWTKKE